MGGNVDRFDTYWRNVAASQRQVVIDGPCASACTIVLFHVKRVCATSRGRFGFHTASFGEERIPAPGYTQQLIRRYPQNVQAFLKTQRLPGPDGMLWVRADKFIARCA